jgi:hypothetical protein
MDKVTNSKNCVVGPVERFGHFGVAIFWKITLTIIALNSFD